MRLTKLLFVTPLALALAAAAGAVEHKATTADYVFSFTYPDAAVRHPGLRAYFEAAAGKLRSGIAREAAAGRREAARGTFPFHRYEASAQWQVVTDTPRFLSLSAKTDRYTGGAHGNPGSAALLWDKATRATVEPKQVFGSLAAVEAALRPAYCRALKLEQTRRNGQAPGPDDTMNACPRFKDLTVLLGSSGGGRINRIGLIADPYVAGSFAEGSYEVTLPVTPAVIRVVKPVYRAAFAAG